MKEIQKPILNYQEQQKLFFEQEGVKAFNCSSFEYSNRIMADLVRNTLGQEAAISLGISSSQQEELKNIFYDASLKVLKGFEISFDQNGEYLPSFESGFWSACDQEGPVAKNMIEPALSILNIKSQDINLLFNNIYVEDAVKNSIHTLCLRNVLDKTQSQQTEQQLLELCKNPSDIKNLFAKVVPKEDYYYNRIFRTEKINDESILKFNNGEPHSESDQKIIDLSLRLANATWLAAQRHCAKKDGKIDRVDPKKRGGVFNTPDCRHVQQFKEAINSGFNSVEAVARVVFELCKDSWMIED